MRFMVLNSIVICIFFLKFFLEILVILCSTLVFILLCSQLWIFFAIFHNYWDCVKCFLDFGDKNNLKQGTTMTKCQNASAQCHIVLYFFVIIILIAFLQKTIPVPSQCFKVPYKNWPKMSASFALLFFSLCPHSKSTFYTNQTSSFMAHIWKSIVLSPLCWCVATVFA